MHVADSVASDSASSSVECKRNRWAHWGALSEHHDRELRPRKREMSRSLSRLLMGAVAGVALAACDGSPSPVGVDADSARNSSSSSESADAVVGPKIVTMQSGLQVLVSGPTESGMDAVVSGTLIEAAHCMAIRVGGRNFLALWPSGSDVNTGRNTITTPDGVSFEVGDDIKGGGGYYEGELTRHVPKIRVQCASAAGVVEISSVERTNS